MTGYTDYWNFRAQVEEVIDGDTVDLLVDQGFRDYQSVRVRLKDVDTAEIYGTKKGSDEYEKGMKQKRFVEDFLSTDTEDAWPVRLESHRETGKYGRWIGDISVNGESLTDAIVQGWPEAENLEYE